MVILTFGEEWAEEESQFITERTIMAIGQEMEDDVLHQNQAQGFG